MSDFFQHLCDHHRLGEKIHHQTVYGGDAHNSVKLTSQKNGQTRHWFVKSNHRRFVDAFAAEKYSLDAIAATQTIAVPKTVAHGQWQEQSYLILPFLHLTPLQDTQDQRQMGEALAKLHLITQTPDAFDDLSADAHQESQHHQVSKGQFGFFMDNFIGTTPQHNWPHSSWHTFWQQRLQSMLKAGSFKDALQTDLHHLQEVLASFFSGVTIQPSLCHGDLWGGNAGMCQQADGNSQAIIYDPATYWGHHETDIAMTRLFGGFTKDFYDAYHHHLPQQDGWGIRTTLYNLYHILNHAVMFGGAYHQQAHHMIHECLDHLGVHH